jgi:hypothetical protein
MKLLKSEIAEAKQELGIQLPVVVKIRRYLNNGTAGLHNFIDGKHYIAVFDFRSVVPMSETLWHELSHAAQAEKFSKETGEPVSRFYDLYLKSPGSLGAEYLHNPFEIEARQVAYRKVHIEKRYLLDA